MEVSYTNCSATFFLIYHTTLWTIYIFSLISNFLHTLNELISYNEHQVSQFIVGALSINMVGLKLQQACSLVKVNIP